MSAAKLEEQRERLLAKEQEVREATAARRAYVVEHGFAPGMKVRRIEDGKRYVIKEIVRCTYCLRLCPLTECGQVIAPQRPLSFSPEKFELLD